MGRHRRVCRRISAQSGEKSRADTLHRNGIVRSQERIRETGRLAELLSMASRVAVSRAHAKTRSAHGQTLDTRAAELPAAARATSPEIVWDARP
jgi:hypothetical protein